MATSTIRTQSTIASAPETGFNLSAGNYTANCVTIGALKIQFGIIITTFHTYHTITFKKAFNDVGYVAFASYTSKNQAALDQPNASITNQTTTSCDIYSGGGSYAWLCIGY